jgi:restriction endonuclease
MYVVRRASGEKELIVVETKDVENKAVLCEEEIARIGCAEVIFDMLSKDGLPYISKNN